MQIDCTGITNSILDSCRQLPRTERFLAFVQVGQNNASTAFIAQKVKTAEQLGIESRVYTFDATISEARLRTEIEAIGVNAECGGIVVQLPLPAHINADAILNTIPSAKDMDVLGGQALEQFHNGKSTILPPAVATVSEILSFLHIDVTNKIVAIVGPGRLVGAPVAAWAHQQHAREILILDKGFDVVRLREADVVVCGAGAPGVITPSLLKPTAIVIDFGYGKTPEGRARGDFDTSAIDQFPDIAYTPTPKGTGPILVACLLRNFVLLNTQ